MDKKFNFASSRSVRAALAVAGLLVLSACTNIGYRCPLDPQEKPDSPTACAGMEDAIRGARLGTGGKTSVLMDDRGRLVPPEVLSGQPARALGNGTLGLTRAVTGASGEPTYYQPQVFQTWSAAYVDDQGNLHDGHNAWFATPGRWDTGSVDAPTAIGGAIMAPAMPNARPDGLLVPSDARGNPILPAGVQVPDMKSAPSHTNAKQGDATPKENKAREQTNTYNQLQRLGQSALGARQGQPQAAAGVTAPAVGLGHR